jgi:hypothetical protein
MTTPLGDLADAQRRRPGSAAVVAVSTADGSTATTVFVMPSSPTILDR